MEKSENTRSYEKAMQELEEVVRKMESGEMGVDVMISELKKAQKLINTCKSKLTKTDEEVKKLLNKE